MTCRLLVAQFVHETHGFNPRITPAEEVAVRRGDMLIEAARGTGTALAGIIEEAGRSGLMLAPTLGFVLRPGGPITDGFYQVLKRELLDHASAGTFDAIALDLHGAMCTTRSRDVEGDLLTALRAIVGDAVPIGAALDMHAHVTRAMVAATDLCIACKTSPHIDFPQTGAKLVQGLAAILAGKPAPARAMTKVPMVHLDAGRTDSGPLGAIRRQADAICAHDPSIWDISLCQVYRFSDYDEPKGQAVVVHAENPDRASALSHELATRFWQRRDEFRSAEPSIDEALDRVAGDPEHRPFVLGDLGDRVLAGAPGDSVAIIAAALDRNDTLRGAATVTDPEAVERAKSAGVDATITLPIGGAISPGLMPLNVTARVVSLSEGRFRITGAVLEGEMADMGATAVLLVEEQLFLVATSQPAMSHSPAVYASQGIDFGALDFVVAKSGMHFAENFAGLATPLMVTTDGLSSPTRAAGDDKHPFWPRDTIENPDLEPLVYLPRRREMALCRAASLPKDYLR